MVEVDRLHIVHFILECTGSDRGATIPGGSPKNLTLHIGLILQHEAYVRIPNWSTHHHQETETSQKIITQFTETHG